MAWCPLALALTLYSVSGAYGGASAPRQVTLILWLPPLARRCPGASGGQWPSCTLVAPAVTLVAPTTPVSCFHLPSNVALVSTTLVLRPVLHCPTATPNGSDPEGLLRRKRLQSTAAVVLGGSPPGLSTLTPKSASAPVNTLRFTSTRRVLEILTPARNVSGREAGSAPESLMRFSVMA